MSVGSDSFLGLALEEEKKEHEDIDEKLAEPVGLDSEPVGLDSESIDAGYETMVTRMTSRSVSPARAQEIVVPEKFEEVKEDNYSMSVVRENVPRVGIRNVRQKRVVRNIDNVRQKRVVRNINVMFNAPVQRIAKRDPRVPVTVVPGGYVMPEIQNWYYQSAFERKPKRSWASQAYPDLFGPEGIYPLAYEEGCDPDCMNEFGECLC